VERPESVADHSFAMALLAWRIARGVPGVDAARVALMALLHDLPEARLTDIPDPAKRRLPEGAFAEAEAGVVREQWPDDDDAVALMEEFREGRTEEAKLARACDNLEFLLQAAFYRDAGRPLTGAMLGRARGGAAWAHPVTRPLVEELLDDESD
jgi:putative hydrolase of HD superfamily